MIEINYTQPLNSYNGSKVVFLGEKPLLKSDEFLNQGLSFIFSSWGLVEANNAEFETFKSNYSTKDISSYSNWLKINNKSVGVSFSTISDSKGRNNATIRADLIPNLVKKYVDEAEDGEQVQVVFVVEKEQAFAAGCAVARAFPLYTRKTKSQSNKTLTVNFVGINGTPLSDINLGELQVVSENIRLAARLSDMPCSELNTNTYIEEVKAAIKGLDNVKLEIIQGEELNQRGFGGLWGVGKAAVNLPALVILSYEPTNKNETSKRIALVGKGICYDTGGLSLKSTTGMPGMKVDMAGSAAVLGSFLSLVKNQTSHTVFGLLCLAENSCDQLSTRPDDILDMYSGVTVEVNNTDAEGRLVLGDGVSYASKHLEVDQIIDIATLTGAQIITTGPNHAGVMSNQEGYETKVVKAGHITGDLAFPMIYSKEFLLKELESEVADLKNSNKNGPTTAASSLAGHFIEAHLDKEYKGVWCHVDIAGPASKKHRCTGFGVALLYELVKQQN